MSAGAGAKSGYYPDYPRLSAGAGAENSPLGYYSEAARQGEPAGLWWGAALPELGLAEGEIVDMIPAEGVSGGPGQPPAQSAYLAVYDQINPATGEKLGRRPMVFRDSRVKRYEDLKEANPGATRQRLRQLSVQAKRESRQSAPYTDVTVTWSKSISVFHASLRENARQARERGDDAAAAMWAAREQRMQDILQSANRAAMAHAEKFARTRTGYHGGKDRSGRQFGHYEAAELAGTSWLQGTSRAGDPHDHCHNLVARVCRTVGDGKWRAVDTMALRLQLPALAAIAAVHLESAMAREFGVSWRPREDGKGNEIDGVTQAQIDEFSARARDIAPRMEARIAQFRAEYGRDPSRHEVNALHDEEWDAGRAGKEEEPADWDALSRKWDAQIGGALAQVAQDVARYPAPGGYGPAPDAGAQARAARQALAGVQAAKATWTRADLVKHMQMALPAECQQMEPAATQALMFDLADRTLAGEFEAVVPMEPPVWPALPARLVCDLDGSSVYTRPGGAKYATRVQLTAEDRLLTTAQRQCAPRMSRGDAARAIGAGADALEAALEESAQQVRADGATASGLRLDQGAALYYLLTSPQLAEVLIGPAGSGKTRTLAQASAAWIEAGGSVLGLATSSAARNVLTAAGVPLADNTSQFLGHLPWRRGARGIQRVMPRGSLILIDEASMMSTADLADIIAWAAANGHKVIVCGDHRQLASIEAGGGLDLLANRAGSVQLAEAVRFCEVWEGPASLRLRQGDPGALEAYADHGRIRGGSAPDVMADARRLYVSHFVQRRDVRLLSMNRAVGRELARHIRSDLRHLGLIDSAGPEITIADGQKASRGDLLRVTANDTDAGVTNKDILRIEAVNDDGSVTVRRAVEGGDGAGHMAWEDRTFRWSEYETAESGLWATGHAAQGQTVGVGIAVVSGNEDAFWLYSAATRGADQNVLCVVTTPAASDPKPGAQADPEIARHARAVAERAGLPELAESAEGAAPSQPEPRDPLAVLADIAARDERELSALETRGIELSDAHNMARLLAHWEGVAGPLRRERYRRAILDALPQDAAGVLGAGGKATWLWRTMRGAEAAGLDVRDVAARAVRRAPLDGARSVAAVIDTRMRQDLGAALPAREIPWSDQVPVTGDPEDQRYLTELAAAMDARKAELGRHAAETSPRWAVTALGPVPEDPAEREDWTRRASSVGVYREAYGWEHPSDPVGLEPSGDAPEKRAAWHAAYGAMTHTDDIDLSADPDSRLHLIRETYRAETAWAPKYPAERLAGIRTALIGQEALAVRSGVEAAAAKARGDLEVAGRHERRAAGAREAIRTYRGQEEIDAGQVEDYEAWSRVTEGTRRLAGLADAELRRRYPDADLPPLATAEDEAPEADLEAIRRGECMAERLVAAAAERKAFAGRLGQVQGVMVPHEDHEMGDLGLAWADPFAEPDKDAILQRPKPPIRPSAQVERLAAERDAGREAEL